MKIPYISKTESERIKELESYQLIGHTEDDDYDFITAMTAQICGTKISLISLITEDKQWFLSHHGLEVRETPKDYAFCAHAINQPNEPFIIEDARKDERFHDNPLTTGDPHVIFYVGIPLVASNGHALGTLCAIDDHPKKLNKTQLVQLQKLARQVIKLFENRKKSIQLELLNEEINKKNELLEETQEANRLGIWEMDIASGHTKWSDIVYEIHEVPKSFNHNKVNGIEFYHPDYRSIITDAITNCISKSIPFDVVCQMITAKKKHIWVRATGRKVNDNIIGSFQNITEIKKQELKFKAIFNSTYTFIGFLDTNGILLEANDTAVNMAGLRHEDVIGKYFWDCYWWQISEKTQEELRTNFQKALSGEATEYEVAVWIANQTPITILFTLKPVFDENGTVIFIIPEGRPVQEQVDARRRYKSVLEGTNVGTWEWNVQTGETIFNERWAEITGYKLEELAPISIETWMKLAHPDDLEESGRRLNECFERKADYYESEARMKHKNGNWVWVYDRGKVIEWTEDGKPLWMYGTHQDISKRKEAEQLQNELLKRFELIGHHVPGVIYQYQLNPDGSSCFPYTSSGIESIYGVTSEQVSNDASSVFKVIHPDDLEKVGETIQESASNLSPWTDIYRVILPSGEIKWLEGNAAPQRKPDGSILWHGYIQDITDRKQKEEQLRISEEAFRGNFENAAVGMAIISPEGQWLKVNQKVCEVVGYPEKELLKLTFQDITHPDDLHTDQALLNEVIEGKRSHYQMEKRYFHKQGHLIHIILAVSVVKDAKGKIMNFISQIVDISKRKKQEEELNYQKNLLSSFYNLSPIGIALNDYNNGKFIDVNNKLIEPTGYTKEEFLALSYWDVTPKEYENLEAIALQQLEDKGKYEMFEKEYIRKDGSRYPVSLQGVVLTDTEGKKSIWSLIRDISHEKEAERKLKEAISNLQAVLDASKQVSIIVTDTEGQITLFNLGAEKMLGYKAEELVGKHTPSIIHQSEEIEKESKALSKKYDKEIRGFETFIYEAQIGRPNTKEWNYKSKNGHITPVLLSINKIVVENTITGYLGVATDITELKKVEKEIRSLLTITERQNDRLKNFAHIVSHNLRSHSGGISGLIELLQLEYPDFANNELLTLLNNSAENLKQTVEDLTEIVKVNLTNEELQHIQLSTVIEKNIQSLSSQISRAGIKIINEIPKTIQIQGILAYVDSIVLNMITNAIKYKSEDRESFLRIYYEEDKTTLTLFFQDNGLGIDLKKHADKLFGMYKTFHRHDDSRGVGLFITKNQLESMGGKISVESEVNIGTTFKITLKNRL